MSRTDLFSGDLAPAPQVLNRTSRLLLGLLGVGLAAALAVAAALQPETQGFGTHRQLGLPNCTFYTLFGRPCPSCGMTTAWAHVVRGEFLAAAEANTAGTLLALCAMGVAPWALLSARRGRLLGGITPRRALVVGGAIMTVAVVQWLLRAAFAAS